MNQPYNGAWNGFPWLSSTRRCLRRNPRNLRSREPCALPCVPGRGFCLNKIPNTTAKVSRKKLLIINEIDRIDEVMSRLSANLGGHGVVNGKRSLREAAPFAGLLIPPKPQVRREKIKQEMTWGVGSSKHCGPAQSPVDSTKTSAEASRFLVYNGKLIGYSAVTLAVKASPNLQMTRHHLALDASLGVRMGGLVACSAWME